MLRKTLNFTVITVLVLAMLMLSACQSTPQLPTTEPMQLQSEPTVPTQPATEPSEPAATEPTATKPATTEPPVTEPPVTEPPVTEPAEKTYTICIDPGHQRYGIFDKEPNGPGSSVMKTKLAAGTRGVSTGIAEYQLNLDVSLLLEQELIKRGYNVVMIRRTNDCPLSNAERSQVANDSGADIFVRIHANGLEDSSANGMLTCAPTTKNPYLSDDVIRESIRLSRTMVDAFCAATGAKNLGILSTDTMTGINWCQIPVTIVEMGFMSNPEEDQRMATDEYRALMVQGIADGIDAYFAE